MKINYHQFLKIPGVLLLALLVLMACGKDDPFLTIESDESFTVPNDGGDFDIAVSTNLGYYEFRFEEGDWLTGRITDKGVTLTAEANSGITERKAVFKIVSLDHPEVNRSYGSFRKGPTCGSCPNVFPTSNRAARAFR